MDGKPIRFHVSAFEPYFLCFSEYGATFHGSVKEDYAESVFLKLMKQWTGRRDKNGDLIGTWGMSDPNGANLSVTFGAKLGNLPITAVWKENTLKDGELIPGRTYSYTETQWAMSDVGAEKRLLPARVKLIHEGAIAESTKSETEFHLGVTEVPHLAC